LHSFSAPFDIDKWIPLERYNDPSDEDIITRIYSEEIAKADLLKIDKTTTATLPQPKPINTLAATPEETKLITNNSIATDENIPNYIPIKETIGKIGLMWPRTYSIHHPAKDLLNIYATRGCPVDCGKNWSKDQIIQSILHGPHKSAQSKAAIDALHEEANMKVKHNFAKIIKFKEIKDNLPPNLKISPVACIPHKSKSFRVILDLSFKLKTPKTTYQSVNETTRKLAKPEAMVQLGYCIQRIIHTMEKHHHQSHPFMFCKLDIKDGFWRLVVNEKDAWNFCYVLPHKTKQKTDLDDTLIVVPHSLQMGWCESPPFFCASSETARDTIKHLLDTETKLNKHKFEHYMMPQQTTNEQQNPPENTTEALEVFVDDFIGVTNDLTHKNLQRMSRAMLHGIHSVFPPDEITLHPGGDSISTKKLEQGEGRWECEKEILGWSFHGRNFTIQLPIEKCKKIIKLIKETIKQKYVPLKKFQSIAGKLQHASLGVPGGAGLFSPLQVAMAGDPKVITITKYLKSALEDWRTIIHMLKNTPTSVRQLVADIPAIIGYNDACKTGVGGVLTPGLQNFPYLVWQTKWPEDIQNRLVTDTNPHGDISMNDLELAGIVLNFLALEIATQDIKYMHIGLYCDNTSAVSWANKLRTSKSIPAARLLRMLGLRMLASGASSLTTLNIPGTENEMADVSSRAFRQGTSFKNFTSLSTFFNNKFPLPQNNSWKELKIPSKILSRVMSCVRGEQLTMESLLKLPNLDKNTGSTGKHMPPSGNKMSSSKTTPNSNVASFSPHLLHGSGLASTAAELKLKFQQSRRRSRPYPRPQNWQDNKVLSTSMTKSTSFRSNAV
jgi:hypothetical protein